MQGSDQTDSLVAADNALWVLATDGVERIDPMTGRIEHTIPPPAPSRVCAGLGAICVLTETSVVESTPPPTALSDVSPCPVDRESRPRLVRYGSATSTTLSASIPPREHGPPSGQAPSQNSLSLEVANCGSAFWADLVCRSRRLLPSPAFTRVAQTRRWPDRQPWPLAASHRRCRTA